MDDLVTRLRQRAGVNDECDWHCAIELEAADEIERLRALLPTAHDRMLIEKRTSMKYMMTWMGVVSGSMGGRDDGYPERKFRIIETLDDLVSSHNPKAEYFRLEPVDVSAAVQAAKDLGA